MYLYVFLYALSHIIKRSKPRLSIDTFITFNLCHDEPLNAQLKVELSPLKVFKLSCFFNYFLKNVFVSFSSRWRCFASEYTKNTNVNGLVNLTLLLSGFLCSSIVAILCLHLR